LEELIQLLYLKRSNIILALAVFVFLVFSLIGVTHAISDKKISSSLTTYSVSKGQSLTFVIEDLGDSKFQKFFLKIYAYLYNLEEIKFGNYEIQNKSFSELIQDMNSGNVIVKSFALIEGMTVFDIKNLFNSLDLANDCINLGCLKKDFGFSEGILYPDTYFYSSDDSLAEILINAELRMAQTLNEVWINKNEDNLNSKSELLILASIIEKEAGNEEEKVLISSVFHNRLKLRMKLQTDPTIIYGLLPNFNGDITRKNLRDKSNPYNTYQISGLPPTPIAIPSITSLIAAANPIESSYIYFVSKGNGTHKFSVTYEEHLAAIEKYQLN